MGESPPAVVVFDVNIYVDLAGLITQPFEWDKLEAAAVGHWNDALPHPTDARFDSLRAVLMSKTGQVGPSGSSERLEVWTSEHIDDLVVKKVHENVTDAAGRGWTQANAEDLLEKLVYDLVFDFTHGGTAGRVLDPLNHPPLDREDGCVMRTAASSGDVLESPRYCVTRDREFREACRADQLEPSVQVLYPHEWVTALRNTRRPPIPRPRSE
ncbi:hypothetical protein [Mycolicibacterium fortuitum]|uniref:hypothetical protein n=1 Tax=Mycolicibacterium fortuitum TaxID=1766 RepID=UPI00241ECBF1|nr:hypothetical protein [Mycolicibacterium fortuitum]MDG5769289.1 hypothetical protein [Mycolicibacterium fortuitum]